jgi:hypothetical protein
VKKIQEVKDLTKLSLEELISSLMTNEFTMDKQEQEEKPERNLTFKIIHHIDDDDDDDCLNHKAFPKFPKEEVM